jgi:hypothetical protein
VLVPVRATRTASSDGSPQTCAQRQSETTDGCIFVQDDGARSCAKERTESPRGGLGIKAGARAAKLEVVTVDILEAYIGVVRDKAPQARRIGSSSDAARGSCWSHRAGIRLPTCWPPEPAANDPESTAPAGGTRLPIAREAAKAPGAAAVQAARRAPAERVGAKRRALMAASTVPPSLSDGPTRNAHSVTVAKPHLGESRPSGRHSAPPWS